MHKSKIKSISGCISHEEHPAESNDTSKVMSVAVDGGSRGNSNSQKRCMSANWHITSRCNYNCPFCFAQSFRPEIKDVKEQEKIMGVLAENGISKLNIVGGEPQLHPDFIKILKMSHDHGFTTTMQTNGSLLNVQNISEIARYADWIGVSLDSGNESTELLLKRGNGKHVETVKRACSLIRNNGLNLKINTTITSLNWNESMHKIIEELGPDRWKIFRMLMVEGENDNAEYLRPSDDQFGSFRETHSDIVLRSGERPVFEDSGDMYGSYLMISPDGMIQTNLNKKIEYHPIEVVNFMNEHGFIDVNKYVERGAIYDWNRKWRCFTTDPGSDDGNSGRAF